MKLKLGFFFSYIWNNLWKRWTRSYIFLQQLVFRLKSIYNLLAVTFKIRWDLQFPCSELSNCQGTSWVGLSLHFPSPPVGIRCSLPYATCFLLGKHFFPERNHSFSCGFFIQCSSLISELFSQTDFSRDVLKTSPKAIRTPRRPSQAAVCR